MIGPSSLKQNGYEERCNKQYTKRELTSLPLVPSCLQIEPTLIWVPVPIFVIGVKILLTIRTLQPVLNLRTPVSVALGLQKVKLSLTVTTLFFSGHFRSQRIGSGPGAVRPGHE